MKQVLNNFGENVLLHKIMEQVFRKNGENQNMILSLYPVVQKAHKTEDNARITRRLIQL